MLKLSPVDALRAHTELRIIPTREIFSMIKTKFDYFEILWPRAFRTSTHFTRSDAGLAKDFNSLHF